MGVQQTASPDAPETDISASDIVRPGADPTELDDDWREAAVRRILSSSALAKASRLSTFLEYVCRLTLQGRKDEINEVNIGINVFERKENYNASDDTIVRTTARSLRQRLKTFYETEGYADSVRIDIPKGTYVPTFVQIGTTSSAATTPDATPMPDELSVTTPEIAKAATARPRQRMIPLISIALIAVVIGAAGTMLFLAPKHYLPWLRTPSDKLWALLFAADHSTYIVPADTTLLQYEVRTRKLVPLNEYLGGNFFLPSDPTPSGPAEPPQRYTSRYTAVTSVQMAQEFGRLPKVSPDRTSVRFARDLQTGDLNQSNAILIGAAQNNPWVQLFRGQMNFHLDWVPEENRWRVINDHPEETEPTEWTWTNDSARTSYSHIALVHNLSGSGYVLILAGTNMFGSEAGSNFIFSPEKMNPLLKRAMRSDGSLGTFEILLQSNAVGTGSINTRVAAARFHP